MIIFIDCPPSLGLLTINSLTAVDSVLIPIQCEFYAWELVSMSTVELVEKEYEPQTFRLKGNSMFDGRTNLAISVVQEVEILWEICIVFNCNPKKR